MMLEVARSIAGSPEKPRRSIAFVGFDLEERGPKGEFGLRGSQFFARHSPVPLERVALFVTADMIGRSLGGVCEPYVFVLGSEHEPEVRPWIARGRRGQADQGRPARLRHAGDRPERLRAVPLAEDPLPLLHDRREPALPLAADVAETIDYPKLEAISRMILGSSARPSTARSSRPGPPARLPGRRGPGRPLRAPDAPGTPRGAQDRRLSGQPDGPDDPTIDEIEGRGSMTPAERTRIARTAQVILFTVF